MLFFHGPLSWFDHPRRRHTRLHEPISPRVPNLMLRFPALAGALMAIVGALGVWYVSSQLPHWPDWALFPSLILSVLALIGLIVGLGMIVVCGLEPLLGRMDWEWHGEPLTALGIPVALERKVESIGYWTADDVAQAVAANRFPWTRLDYDERLQIERAAQRWQRHTATATGTAGAAGAATAGTTATATTKQRPSLLARLLLFVRQPHRPRGPRRSDR